MSKPGSPGCALGVYRDGKIIHSKGYGLANIEGNVPITPQFAAENIFQPLGMTHTQYRNDHTSLIPNRALAYEAATEKDSYKLSVSYGEQNGDGGVHTSIEDLQKWDENFYSAQVGGKQLRGEMEEQVKLDDGRTLEHAMTLYIQNYRGLRTMWFSGGLAGYRAYLLRFPEQHFSVACLCNLASVNRAKRAHAVSDLYLDRLMKPKEGASVTNLTAQQLQGLIGTYRDARTREVWRVSIQAGKLWVDFEGRPAELRALTPTEFEVADWPWETHLTFKPSQKGTARTLIVKQPFQLAGTAEAVEERKPVAGELAAFAGDYWSSELQVTYRLTIKDGRLWMKDLIGADGFVYAGTISSNELRPVFKDEFDLKGAPITIHFTRDEKHNVTGFTLDGFGERHIVFARLPGSNHAAQPSESPIQVR